MQETSTRDRIVQQADQLFYELGFEHTSFARIAQSIRISRGNFYHHFKSKDDILNAVVDLRIQRTQAMLDDWQKQGETPKERVSCFINILIQNKAKILLYGCPVGTLSTELVKLDHVLKSRAKEIFGLFRTWLRQQFELMGHSDQADLLAMHVLSQSQGIATLANAFHDEQFILQEVVLLNQWLDQLSDLCIPATTSN